jgi:hypothetical protein
MTQPVDYSPRVRFWLWVLAAFGLFAANGAFIYGLLFQPNAMREAMANPIAAAFIVEALVLTVVLAYLLRKWGVTRVPVAGFVALSLIGSLAFALPVALLWRRRSMEGV